MAKNKNPLKDLDAFLKQQASSLVSPEKVEKKEDQAPKENPVTDEVTIQQDPSQVGPLLDQIVKSDSNFRPKLYDSLIEALEKAEQSTSQDKLLINTLLYLKNPSTWRNSIKEYWEK